jgi:uroporphyrinogen-III synthase
MKINTYVLSTAQLDNSLITTALEHGIELDASSFIQVEPIRENNLKTELEGLCKLPLTVVFTSANAINAISAILSENKPKWDIYCIGNATRKTVLEYFDAGLIKGTANDGAGLAKVIKSHDVSDVVFFCGDKRLDALPDFLYANDIMVREIVVYKTTETPELIKKHYQAIMFFSPNGVNSFFRVNKIWPHTVLFAIGNTTANAIKTKSNNTIVVSETPSKEQMVETVIQYFHK